MTPERIEAKKRQLAKKQELRVLFSKYDVNSSGKLQEPEVRLMLTDLDCSTPPGTEPTDEEMRFILSVADRDDDSLISREEIEYVMDAWCILHSQRSQMEAALREFDASGNGKLEKPELKKYLTSLNGGIDVPDDEVDWVMSQADVFNDGAISQTEMVMATAAWYANVEQDEDCTTDNTKDNRIAMMDFQRSKIEDSFRKYDLTGNGSIGLEELTTLLSKTGVPVEHSKALFAAMDKNSDNLISFNEFVSYLFAPSAGALPKP
jgi:Ca2+-binding EF-hand superfamily protein